MLHITTKVKTKQCTEEEKKLVLESFPLIPIVNLSLLFCFTKLYLTRFFQVSCSLLNITTPLDYQNILRFESSPIHLMFLRQDFCKGRLSTPIKNSPKITEKTRIFHLWIRDLRDLTKHIHDQLIHIICMKTEVELL